MRYALFLSILLAACRGPAPHAKEAEPAAAPPRTSMKGWELYAQRDNEDLRFVLLPGTNRLKGADEVAKADSARGVEGLRRLLGSLARGQTVLCRKPVDTPASGWLVPRRGTELGETIVAEAERRELVVYLPSD